MKFKNLFFIILSAIFISCGGDKSTNEGDRYFNAGDYENAISAYTKYLQLESANVKTLYNRGRAYEELEEYDKAMEDYNHVLKIDPKHAQAYLSIGKEYIRREDYNNAAYNLNRAVEYSGEENAQAFFLRGLANHRSGNTDLAMDDYNAAIKIDNKYGQAFLYRGALKIHLNDRKSGCADIQTAKSLDVQEAESFNQKFCQ